jgi:hypothetical protein
MDSIHRDSHFLIRYSDSMAFTWWDPASGRISHLLIDAVVYLPQAGSHQDRLMQLK